MRIGVEAQRIFRNKKHGMDVVALQVLLSLQELDHENEYVVFVKPDEDRDCLKTSNNLEIVEIPALSYPDWEQIHLPRVAKKHGVEILHCTSNTAPMFSAIPSVITLHDVIYLENLNFGGTAYQNFGNIYRRWIVPRVVKTADCIITVSEYEKEKIVSTLKLPPEKVKVVYNAISNKFHNNYSAIKLDDIRVKYDLPEQFILFLGNNAPKKNTERVLKSYVKYCKQVTFPIPLVVLDYEFELIAKLLKSEKGDEYLKYIISPGYIAASEIALIYNLATLFLYPSLRESFGLPIIEAMACGTPVITSNTSAMPEVAGGAAILIDPFNVDDLSNQIVALLSNNTLRDTKIEQGLQRAKAFSWDNAAMQVLNIYQAVLQR